MRKEDLYTGQGVSLYLPYSLEGRAFSSGQHSTQQLCLGSVADLRLVVDKDIAPRYRDRKRYYRLGEFIRTQFGPNETPVYIVDHHQYALYAWFEAYKEGRIGRNTSLVHYDEHSDARIASDEVSVFSPRDFRKDKWTLTDARDQARNVGCWQFIEPTVTSGMIKDVLHVSASTRVDIPHYFPTTSKTIGYTHVGMDEYRRMREQQRATAKIVDIDLDYFAAEGYDPQQEDQDIQTMRDDIVTACVATFATSPGFIDPEKAVALIKRILL